MERNNVEGDVQVVYFSRHEAAGYNERQEGMKLGRIVDKGYRVLMRDGHRFEISTIDWGLNVEDKSEEIRRVKEIIKSRLGRKDLDIRIS